MEPASPFVQARLLRLWHDFNVTVPCDLLFEDQIGARPWLDDYSTWSQSKVAFVSNWIKHTQLAANSGLHVMTEQGFDLLAGSETGFSGSILRSPQPDQFWGPNTYYSIPFAPAMGRASTLFYQHDLATDTFAHDLEVVTFDLAHGYQLTANLGTALHNKTVAAWLRVVSGLQYLVLSEVLDDPLIGFDVLEQAGGLPKLVNSSFQDHFVVSNRGLSVASIAGLSIAPHGFYLSAQAGNIVAASLADGSGNCFVWITRQNSTSVDMWLLSGPVPTVRSVVVPPAWGTANVTLSAYNIDNELLDAVPFSRSGMQVTYTWNRNIKGQLADYFSLALSTA